MCYCSFLSCLIAYTVVFFICYCQLIRERWSHVCVGRNSVVFWWVQCHWMHIREQLRQYRGTWLRWRWCVHSFKDLHGDRTHKRDKFCATGFASSMSANIWILIGISVNVCGSANIKRKRLFACGFFWSYIIEDMTCIDGSSVYVENGRSNYFLTAERLCVVNAFWDFVCTTSQFCG